MVPFSAFLFPRCLSSFVSRQESPREPLLPGLDYEPETCSLHGINALNAMRMASKKRLICCAIMKHAFLMVQHASCKRTHKRRGETQTSLRTRAKTKAPRDETREAAHRGAWGLLQCIRFFTRKERWLPHLQRRATPVGTGETNETHSTPRGWAYNVKGSHEEGVHDDRDFYCRQG